MFRSKNKVFCIGRNKTGTTSIKTALQKLGFKVGNQARAEMLMSDWSKRDFRRIIKYAKTADAFQDVPFSLSYTYQALDAAFPESKFILTVRDSVDQWYESIIRFHTTIIGKNRLPTVEDLKNFQYRERGWVWKQQQIVYKADESSLYDPDLYKAHYESHNEQVIDYFFHRKNDLLVLNISEADAIKNLCAFLEKPWDGAQMPHENTSRT